MGDDLLELVQGQSADAELLLYDNNEAMYIDLQNGRTDFADTWTAANPR